MQMCSQGVPLAFLTIASSENKSPLFMSLTESSRKAFFFCWFKQLHLLWELEGCGHFSFSFVLSYAFLINRKNIKCIFSMEVQHFHRLASCVLRCWRTSQSHEMKIHQEKIYFFNLRKLYYVTINCIFFQVRKFIHLKNWSDLANKKQK